MTGRKTLFSFVGTGIKIDIEAYFDKEDLLIEGYDIGPTVKEAWGDSDYEYELRIKSGELPKLYTLFKVQKNDKEGLLEELVNRYHTNSCFSEISKFLSENNIEVEGSSWT